MEMEKEKRKKVKLNYHKLPFDVIIDIFSRLPSKSLSRFRCVSKEFLNSIFNSHLYRLHYQLSCQKPFSISMLVLNKSGDLIDHIQHYGNNPTADYDRRVKQRLVLSMANHEGQPIGQLTREIEVKIEWGKAIGLMSSHGNLVCISTTSHIYIFSPTRQEFVELPCSPSRQQFVQLPRCIDYDFEVCAVGFGYVPSKDEYKVVRCFVSKYDVEDDVGDELGRENYELGCEILTISNYGTKKNNYNLMDSFSAWRELEEGCPHIMSQSPVLVNGSLHWKIDQKSEKSIVMEEEILSFNLKEEKFWILPAPQCVRDSFQSIKFRNFSLVELREKLWLNHFEIEWGLIMDMWVLKDFDKFIWVKEYSIDLSPINDDRWLGSHTLWVINITRDEELLIRNEKRQFYFNTETKKFTELERPDHMFSFFYYIDV